MKSFSRKIAGALLAAALAGAGSTPASAVGISVGTGSPSGVYYQVGRAVCRLVNAGTAMHGVSCKSSASAGSIANLEDLRAGKLDVAVAQSDWQFHAVHGSGPFAQAGPDKDLRALFSVHGEPFTVVARRDAGVLEFDDLKGLRVNVGNPGSGQRATMEVVMRAKGWTMDDFALANDLPASQQSLALCHDRVQAMVYTVGHPNASVAQAAGLCDARIVEVSGPAVDRLVADNPFYAHTTVPGGIYPGNPEPVVTFGVLATVVASARMDDQTAYALMRAVFEGLGELRRMHPAFGALEAAAMARDGLTAPLHPGAKRYFDEKGLGM